MLDRGEIAGLASGPRAVKPGGAADKLWEGRSTDHLRKSSQLFRRLNQAQEQQRSGQTGRDGKRCAALLGLTRQCGTWECSLFTLEETLAEPLARSQVAMPYSASGTIRC